MTFIDTTLARRMEDAQAWRAVHYAQASMALTHVDNSAMLTIAGAPIVYGGPGIPVNRAIGLGMHGPVTTSDLDAVEAFYHERHADSVIDLCPLAHPSLLALLQARHYHLRNWMSMLFMSLPSTSTSLNPSLYVTRATADQADLWIATSGRGFDETTQVAAETLNILSPNFYAQNAHCYFAWLKDARGDQPIATGAMYPHNGVAELGGASTLRDYRQQGGQTALIQQRLDDAYAQQCDLAVVLTTPGSNSQRNLQRRGFQLAYTRAIAVRSFTS